MKGRYWSSRIFGEIVLFVHDIGSLLDVKCKARIKLSRDSESIAWTFIQNIFLWRPVNKHKSRRRWMAKHTKNSPTMSPSTPLNSRGLRSVSSNPLLLFVYDKTDNICKWWSVTHNHFIPLYQCAEKIQGLGNGKGFQQLVCEKENVRACTV